MAEILTTKNIDFIGINYKQGISISDSRIRIKDVRDASLSELIKDENINAVIHMAFCTNP